MAHFLQRVGLLVATLAVTVRTAQAGFPTLVLKTQDDPILEGSNVTLECLTDEEGENLTDYTLQKYNKWLNSWISLDKANALRCWFFGITVSRENQRLLLAIGDLKSWHTGRYRCVGSNVTSNASVSEELDLKMEYLHRVTFTQTNSWCGTVGETITVREGDNLEIQCSADASKPPLYEWSREDGDWIMVSRTLTFTKVSREEAGIYTCQARHPSLPQLTQSKSIHLFVVPLSERSFKLDSVLSLNTPMLALAVALPAVLLLLVILVLAFIIPRHRAVAKKKAALEDSGQRTPIYKGSLESVPSVAGDTHPLVMG